MDLNGLKGFLVSRTGIVLTGFLAIAGYFLWTEHQAHLISALPWLLVGGCLLMHLFMHHGHGSHGSAKENPASSADDAAASTPNHDDGSPG